MTLETIAIVQLLQQPQKICSFRNDRVVVEIRMQTKVMSLDLFHVHCFLHSWHLINLSAIIENRWRRRNTLSACLEINKVYLVKTKKSDNQADVGLSKLIACYVPLLLKNFINPVKRLCELGDGLVIGFLRLREPTSIDPVVDSRINPFIHCFNLLLQLIGIEVKF